MVGRSARHEAVAAELAERWEDVCGGGIGSQVVLVKVPAGWGISAVLEEFRQLVSDPDGPVQILVSVDDVPVASRAVEAGALRDALRAPFSRSAAGRAAELLGLDSVAGEVQLGLGLGGLFASGMAAAAGLLLGSLAVTAAGNAWDASAAGEQGGLARAARALAAVSVAVPVAVVIEETDQLAPDFLVTMIENLVGRSDGRVLVVAVTGPGSALAAELAAADRYELRGRVRTAEADPAMGYGERADLARELCPWLPAAVIDRIARRTRTFAEVLTVAKAGRLADLTGENDPAAVASVVDAVIEAGRVPEEIPVLAVVLGWAGGALTVRQADRAMHASGFSRESGEEAWVAWSGGLVRLRDPGSARVADQVAAFGSDVRRELAAAVLAGAADIARDSQATLVEQTVARLAAHQVRADLTDRDGLAAVQSLLIQGLEQLGDLPAARQVAHAALAELPAAEQDTEPGRDLQTAVLRLAGARPGTEDDPLIQDAVAQAQANSPLLGLEARVWAAVHLLNRPGSNDAAMTLAGQVAARLAGLPGSDATANQWRILIAFHAGRAGNAALSQQILSPVITSGTAEQQEAAQAVLRAIGGPRADTRLQIIMLEAELAATPAAATAQLLHLHRTLARDYGTLGDYRNALRHGMTWNQLSVELHGADHSDTLTARYLVSFWTGGCGDFAEALRLCWELLPDQIRVLGADHPDVLTTRGDIAFWTGRTGQAAKALRLSRELLPDAIRVLGPDHFTVLKIRNNIAFWAARCGNAPKALRLFQELLPDQIRVLGADHPDVQATRNNIAAWTGFRGNAPKALRLFQELLPDQIRVLGADHPEVLTTRNNIAFWTARCGNAAKALRLFQELLPDAIRVLRADHPSVLSIRNNIAVWTAQCGNIREALRLLQELLPDQIQVLGADHPDVQATRNRIAALRG